MPFSTVAAPAYIPTSSARGLPSPTPSPASSFWRQRAGEPWPEMTVRLSLGSQDRWNALPQNGEERAS